MAESDTKKPSLLMLAPARWVFGGFAIWLAFVAASGAGVQIGGPWNFTVTGQLGDSFGILSAFMASMAAIFTYQTLTDTREQRVLAEREAAERRKEALLAREDAASEREEAEKRETERSKAEHRRDAEGTFFRLLELRFRVLADLKIGKGSEQRIGTDAAEMYIGRILPGFYDEPAEFNLGDSYRKVFADNANDLGHYFRFTYHAILFAREQFGRDAYRYVRLLRAQLSSSEITLIALNCAHGEGREKFKELVEVYSLLHNITSIEREQFSLDEYFSPRAFDPSVTLEESRSLSKKKKKRK